MVTIWSDVDGLRAFAGDGLATPDEEPLVEVMFADHHLLALRSDTGRLTRHSSTGHRGISTGLARRGQGPQQVAVADRPKDLALNGKARQRSRR